MTTVQRRPRLPQGWPMNGLRPLATQGDYDAN
jgi:hypothetical protein